MWLKSITLCCLLLNVQPQQNFSPVDYNSAIIFPDSSQSVIPLSVPNRNELDSNAARSIFSNNQAQKPRPSVEIERTLVSEIGSTAEQQNGNRQNTATLNQNSGRQLGPQRQDQSQVSQIWEPVQQPAYDRQVPPQRSQEAQRIYESSKIGSTAEQQNGNRRNPATLNQNSGQQLGPQRQVQSQVSQIWEPVQQPAYDRQVPPQRSQEAQRIYESSLGRGQSEPNRSNTQQLTQALPNFSPLPQRPQGGPSTVVSQNALVKPAGFQIPSKPPPISSNSNFPTEAAQGFNQLLFSVSNFGINMIKTIKGLHPGNLVVSPFSITLLLGLLQQGASGQTQAQITKALSMSPETTVPAYYKISEDVKFRTNSRNILRITNNIFMADTFATTPEFRYVAVNNFSTEVTPISFSKPRDAARQINSWVSSRTGGKIENLIAPDAIDYTTQMVLVNTIYFKGLWEVPFRVELTKNNEFHLSNGRTKTVQFMRMRKLFKTGRDNKNNADVIILPFERDEYQLMVILPSELVGMDSTLESLNADRLVSYHSFPALDTELELPKFTIKANTDLTVVLQKMGVTDLFRRDLAELHGIGYYGANGPHISSAVHSAFLSIDEKGGTAAAATAFAAVALSYDDPDVNFKVNRPFIAVLWDKQSSLPLFMAKIEDPQQ